MDAETLYMIEEPRLLHQHSHTDEVKAIVYDVPHSLYTSRIKRLVDVVVSSVLIVLLLSWMVPVLFLLIRLTSRGSLFFTQQRTGRFGRYFTCIKFRTMRLNNESETAQARIGDKRITGIGKFLRVTHIDELPQLINVLLGDMSLVGPRPHMLYHDMLFSDLLPNYQARHMVKPGITGLAQAAGYHGTTTDFYSISSRTRLDLFYVRRMSLALDLRIVLKTLFLVPVKFIVSVKRMKRGYGSNNTDK